MQIETGDKMLDNIIANINDIKGVILQHVIEQIEGRPAELSDAQNIVLATDISISPSMQMVVYRGVHIGNIDFNMIERNVTFTPTNASNENKAPIRSA